MTVYPVLLVQNKFIAKENVKYPFEERGLQFGDGIYEVIRIYNGHYFLLQEHVDRLFRSAKAIKLQLPFPKQEIIALLGELLKRNNIKTDGKVYLQITRGSAPRDHAFPSNTSPNLYAYIQDLPRNFELLTNGVSTITLPDIRWKNCFIKSLNLLPNILAKQEAKEKGCFEAILHEDGIITEGSSSNIYMVQDQKIYTYPAAHRILNGCIRMQIKKFAKELQVPFIERAFSVINAYEADEVFLTSSTAEITPIIKIDDHVIGDGNPGATTKRLQGVYEQNISI